MSLLYSFETGSSLGLASGWFVDLPREFGKPNSLAVSSVRTSYGHQLLSCPRARCAQEWWSPALSTLPGKQTVITCNIPVLDLLCRRSREPTELKVLSSASGVKTEQGKRSTSVIAQIYSNSTPASGIVFLEPRGRFLIQHQWIYCIFDLFTRCLILQQLILAFCTWDWFLNNLFPFHIN